MSMWRILVADDEPLVRQMIHDILTALPASVLTAQDGEEALRLAKTEMPDLIVLDVMMPRLDGFGVAEALKRDAATERIPLIFISALGASRDKVRGLDLGAEDYLIKPIDADQLRNRIRMILKRLRPPKEKPSPAPGRSQELTPTSTLKPGLPPTEHPRQPIKESARARESPQGPPREDAQAPHQKLIQELVEEFLEKAEESPAELAQAPVQEPVPPTGILASGQLHAMNLESLVQLLENERHTARLLLARGAERGEIAFAGGAITRAIQGPRQGEAAVYQLLTWREGTFQLESLDAP
ncbi:MAG: response regulator, partial [Candidatus Methylomirabilota bacterium]